MATGTADADYVCTLTDESLKKAKDELNEAPKERMGQLQKFRELVLQQPHIKCPTGKAHKLNFAVIFVTARHA